MNPHLLTVGHPQQLPSKGTYGKGQTSNFPAERSGKDDLGRRSRPPSKGISLVMVHDFGAL